MNLCIISIHLTTILWGLVHTCRQNPRLSIDKSPILSIDCCGTNSTWSRTFCHLSIPATCLWTIAELFLQTEVRDFVYKCVLSLKPAIHLSSNWRKREKMLAKREKWEVYRWHFVNHLVNHFSHLAFRRSHQMIGIFMKCQRGR